MSDPSLPLARVQCIVVGRRFPSSPPFYNNLARPASLARVLGRSTLADSSQPLARVLG